MLRQALEATFAANDLDAVIYPEQKNLVVKIGAPSQAGRNGILAALTGVPVVVVPAGFSEPSDEAPVRGAGGDGDSGAAVERRGAARHCEAGGGVGAGEEDAAVGGWVCGGEEV